MTWPIVHSIVSGALVLWSIGMLLLFKPRYNLLERLGLGLMAGGGILRVNVIMEMQGSPFFSWGPVVAISGALLLLMGRSLRDWHHEFANTVARWKAWRHLKRVGKL